MNYSAVKEVKLRMELRTVQIKRSESWSTISFRDLKNGDTFRIFEPTGESLSDKKGNTIFKAVSDPYKNNDQVWTIDAET